MGQNSTAPKNSRGMPGNGLGLSIVEIIVRRLQGSCDLRSQENTGTVFHPATTEGEGYLDMRAMGISAG